MTDVVLDAGALIALEENERGMWALLKLAVSEGTDVLVPSTALAQAWRGTPRQAQLAKALDHCRIVGFDPSARAVGELCGRTGTKDIADAHVAIVAAAPGRVLYTSDPVDQHRLLVACGRKKPSIVRC